MLYQGSDKVLAAAEVRYWEAAALFAQLAQWRSQPKTTAIYGASTNSPAFRHFAVPEEAHGRSCLQVVECAYVQVPYAPVLSTRRSRPTMLVSLVLLTWLLSKLLMCDRWVVNNNFAGQGK